MIQEMFSRSVSAWQQYWGDGYMVWLLAAAMILLVIRAVKDKDARSVLIYSAAVLFLFFCPFTAYIITWAVGKSVYWRVLWLLPTGIVIAYAFTSYLRLPGKAWVRIPGVIAVLVIAALCGRSQYDAGSYVLTHNRPQVPDSIAQIAETIKADAPDGTAVAAGNDFVASYLRVYDASIRMPYGRRADGALGEGGKRLYELLQTPGSDPQEISDLAHAEKCTHLVVYQPGKEAMELYREDGWKEIGSSEGYYILSETGT